MFRALARGGAVAASAALVLAVAPAHAQTRTTDDPRRDVWLQDSSAPSGFSQAGTHRNVDLVSTKVTHAAGALSLKATYTDLVRNDDEIELAMLVKTPDHAKHVVFLIAGSGARQGQAHLMEYGSGQEVTCDGMATKLNYGTEVARVSVPRSCLGRPDWVKFEAAAAAFTASGMYIDDARSTGAEPQPTDWSAKVFRG